MKRLSLPAILGLAFALGLALCLTGCSARGEGEIVATNFPCYDFARQVAGDAVAVRMLLHPGAEAHAYEPSPSDIRSIGDAALFVYIGGESDAWADDILSSFGDDAPASVRLIECVAALEEEHEHDHGEEVHLELDEHIWTSPKNAAVMVRSVAGAMCAAFPEHADAFRANAERYAAEIERIDRELTEIVAGGARRELVFADRFPFLYLAHDYGLSYRAAFPSCTADTEPSARTLIELIEAIRAEDIPVVYTLELSSGTIGRMLAEETGVRVLRMHSAQTVSQSEFDAGESYVSLMRENLEAIREGLN